LKCRLCAKSADTGDFCELHAKAHSNITKTYESWNKALGIS
jgi:hypothetical protein